MRVCRSSCAAVAARAAFLDRAFGRRIAGPLNLLLWLSYFVMLALYAVAFGAYLAALLGLDPNGIWRRILGSAVIVSFAAFNLLGARVVGRAESVLVYFKLAVLLVFVVGGLFVVDTGPDRAVGVPVAGRDRLCGCADLPRLRGIRADRQRLRGRARPRDGRFRAPT